MKLLGARVIVLALALAACDDEVDAGEAAALAAAAAAAAEAEAPVPEPLYDAQGNLLESDTVVAGLRLPRGLELVHEADREHIYESRSPIDKINRYFGPRLVTGEVSERGSGGIFRGAVPRDARGGVVRLDVSILPAGRARTRISIYELPPAPVNPPSEAEIREQLAEDSQRWD